jgi:phosphate starvation-inducible PhoH-like protein
VDVLCDRYGKGFYESSLENGVIEYCPLEYIRGRNIASVAIADEFQNVKPSEAYTLVTRVAQGGKLICIGDSTQTDISGKTGLEWLYEFVERHGLQDHVSIIKATSDDIVRGDWCKEAVKAMESDRKNGIKF